ncbi:MAG: dTMP kinase [Caloramator sp.]|nr:dTMP kinase [Caloramator sp.]
MKGLFITFEGPDGSGKTTQINLLNNYLTKCGYDVILTREPGGTKISEKIREVILNPENKGMSPICEALLYAAARAQHVYEVIIPALNSGKIVICDRFTDSSVVYQGYARGLGEDLVENINHYATLGIEPNITFLLNLPAEIGIKRKKESKTLDRLEQESIIFHEKVCEGYNRLKNRHKRIFEIDAAMEADKIHSIIIEKIKNIL